MKVIAHPLSNRRPSHGLAMRSPLPTQRPEADHYQLAVAAERAYAEGQKVGYIQGARAGRVAGACWGALLCAASVLLYSCAGAA